MKFSVATDLRKMCNFVAVGILLNRECDMLAVPCLLLAFCLVAVVTELMRILVCHFVVGKLRFCLKYFSCVTNLEGCRRRSFFIFNVANLIELES
jgi:hypothetical protein